MQVYHPAQLKEMELAAWVGSGYEGDKLVEGDETPPNGRFLPIGQRVENGPRVL